MAPLPSRPGHGLLCCPICRLELTAAAGALVCRNRHNFDIAREGYVNLLRARRHRPAMGGDSAAQLQHRAAFLETSHFDAVATTIARHVQHGGAQPISGLWHVLDAGCGTGHHLAKLAVALPRPVVGLGLDIAKEAARQAARHWPIFAFAVADLWTEWPVHDEAVDVVLSIFAPKNFPETARVLRSGGWLALAYPGPYHLVELKDQFALMHPREDAPRHYAEMSARYIGPPTVVRLLSRAVLDAAALRAAILMGPNAHHIATSALDTVPEALEVTFDITVLFARKHD